MNWYIVGFIGLVFIGLVVKLYFGVDRHIDKMVDDKLEELDDFSISKEDLDISWDIHRMAYLSMNPRNYNDLETVRTSELKFERLCSWDDIEKTISRCYIPSCDHCKIRKDFGLGVCTMCGVLKDKVDIIRRHQTLEWYDMNCDVSDFEIPKIKETLFGSEEVSKYKPRNYNLLNRKPTVESMHKNYIDNIKDNLTREYYNEKR